MATPAKDNLAKGRVWSGEARQRLLAAKAALNAAFEGVNRRPEGGAPDVGGAQ